METPVEFVNFGACLSSKHLQTALNTKNLTNKHYIINISLNIIYIIKLNKILNDANIFLK